MSVKNHNIRFNQEKEQEARAWELLHSEEIRRMFRSQNEFVIRAINDFYDRSVHIRADPYLESREKEDAFADRIVERVENKFLSELPRILGTYLIQGTANPGNYQESPASQKKLQEPEENDLLDYDAFG